MSWLRSLRSRLGRFSHSKSSTRARKRSRQLTVRSLEDRVVPSVAMVGDLNNYTVGSFPTNMTNVGGTLYFTAQTYGGTTTPGYLPAWSELFKSDGTASGTVQLTFGTQFRSIDDLVALNGKLFFTASPDNLGTSVLCSTDGTVAGTQPFVAGGYNVYANYTNSTSYTTIGNKLYFEAADPSNGLRDLWVSDGSSVGTHPVQPGNAAAANNNLTNFTNVNGKLFFESYNNSDNKYTLWMSNGTAAGTSQVTELTAFQANNFTAVGNKLYFEMFDSATSRYALWVSDGTSTGTTMVGDIGSNNSQFGSLTAFGSKLFFQVNDSTDAPNTGWALWVYDGTNAPAAFKYAGGVTAVQVGGNTQMIVFGGALYFNGYSTGTNNTLYKTDGIAANANTAPLQVSGSTPLNFYPTDLTINGSEMYFRASISSLGWVLWKTDGSSAGTVPVQSSGYGYDVSNITAAGNKLFFQAYDEDVNHNTPHSYELWVSDGVASANMVTDLNTQTLSSNPQSLVAVGNELFFKAANTYNPWGNYLWQTDGTMANTVPVQTSTGTLPTSAQNMTAVGSTLFFTATDPNVHGTSQNELWTTGTGLDSAVDVTGSLASNPFGGSFASTDGTSFVSFNGLLYFGAYHNATAKWALWKSDGTAAGTTVIADLSNSYGLKQLTVVGSSLFWEQYDPTASNYALWKYDGTTASQIMDITSDSNGLTQLTAVGGQLFFQANDTSTHDYALWTSDGTAAGTSKLGEFGTGQQLLNLTAFNNRLYFGAHSTAVNQWQLWTSDGTPTGTTQFFTSNGEPVDLYNNSAANFLVAGSEMYFATFDSGESRNLLAKTDGTAAGTFDVQAGSSSTILAGNPSYLAYVNGMVVFSAADNTHGFELWQSDGTANGTLMMADIVPGGDSSSPQFLTTAGNQVFFAAEDGVHGYELWSAAPAASVVTAGISGPTDGVTMQTRDFVLTATDSNTSNNPAGYSFAINWGDGSTQTTIGQSGLSAAHQYANSGNYTIRVTATNLADGVSSIAVSQVDSIAQTELQGGNFVVGGIPGNDTIVVTKGNKATNYTIKYNGTPVVSNFVPATGEEIFLYGGSGTNTVTIVDSFTTKDTFTLGAGYVTFAKATLVPQMPVTWNITANNSSIGNIFNIKAPITATITGGTGPDAFNFYTGAVVTGSLTGGGGVDTLSYAKYGHAVAVDLLQGSATAISGGISGIRNVTGSSLGGDILVGDANANILKANKGHNIVIGGSGGGDTLTSGGMDILIAGTAGSTPTQDYGLAEYQTILNTWKTATSTNYQSVINTIQSASFADPLNTSTVFDSGSPDLADSLSAHGATDVDWFFANLSGSGTIDTVNTLNGAHDTKTDI